MGQYYHIVNVDKKQIMVPHDFYNGLKLMEWAYSGNWLALALLNLLKSEWKGDRVYVVGDYAETSDKADGGDEVWYDAYDKAFEEIAQDYTREPDDEDYEPTIYSMTYDDWERITPEDVECKSSDVRFIYNHETKQYIDLWHCPIEWIYRADQNAVKAASVAPLPLLLAMGNGRGGGDYWEGYNNAALVGEWCATSASIDCEAEPVEAFGDYTEFAPDFTERRQIVPYTELDAEILAYLQGSKGL